jgi:xylitol oxidase
LQSEYLLPREAAPAAFAAMRDLGGRLAPALQISEIRTAAADDLWLSPAHGRETVAAHFTWIADERTVMPVVTAVEEQLMPLGARPHWGKVFAAGLPSVAALYDRAADFRRLRKEYDPAGTFGNDFVDALFPLD